MPDMEVVGQELLLMAMLDHQGKQFRTLIISHHHGFRSANNQGEGFGGGGGHYYRAGLNGAAVVFVIN